MVRKESHGTILLSITTNEMIESGTSFEAYEELGGDSWMETPPGIWVDKETRVASMIDCTAPNLASRARAQVNLPHLASAAAPFDVSR